MAKKMGRAFGADGEAEVSEASYVHEDPGMSAAETSGRSVVACRMS